jgi:hypothetical protein
MAKLDCLIRGKKLKILHWKKEEWGETPADCSKVKMEVI